MTMTNKEFGKIIAHLEAQIDSPGDYHYDPWKRVRYCFNVRPLQDKYPYYYHYPHLMDNENVPLLLIRDDMKEHYRIYRKYKP